MESALQRSICGPVAPPGRRRPADRGRVRRAARRRRRPGRRRRRRLASRRHRARPTSVRSLDGRRQRLHRAGHRRAPPARLRALLLRPAWLGDPARYRCQPDSPRRPRPANPAGRWAPDARVSPPPTSRPPGTPVCPLRGAELLDGAASRGRDGRLRSCSAPTPGQPAQRAGGVPALRPVRRAAPRPARPRRPAVKADFTRRTFAPQRHATRRPQAAGPRRPGRRLERAAGHRRCTCARLGLPTFSGLRARRSTTRRLRHHAGRHRPAAVEAGRYYVGGLRARTTRRCRCSTPSPTCRAGPSTHRPGRRHARHGRRTVAPAVYLAYLDVWTQLRTAVEDPALREVALGGPDTATRARTVWQVRLLEAAAGHDPAVHRWNRTVGGADRAVHRHARGVRETRGRPPTDRLRRPVERALPGLDNQYYRVEIHDGGAPGTASYVVVAATTARRSRPGRAPLDTVLTVKSARPRRRERASSAGTWAELTDDLHELTGPPGHARQVDRAEGDQARAEARRRATGSLDPPTSRCARACGAGTGSRRRSRATARKSSSS